MLLRSAAVECMIRIYYKNKNSWVYTSRLFKCFITCMEFPRSICYETLMRSYCEWDKK